VVNFVDPVTLHYKSLMFVANGFAVVTAALGLGAAVFKHAGVALAYTVVLTLLALYLSVGMAAVLVLFAPDEDALCMAFGIGSTANCDGEAVMGIVLGAFVLAVLAAFSCCLCGCQFFRSLSHRPSLAAMRRDQIQDDEGEAFHSARYPESFIQDAPPEAETAAANRAAAVAAAAEAGEETTTVPPVFTARRGKTGRTPHRK